MVGFWRLRLENVMGGFMLRRRVLIGIDRRLTIGFGRRGFMLRQNDILIKDSWSEPVFFDQVGFDQDVSSFFS